ncbi:metallophosphoesterase [Paenibacillus sp. FSL R7-0302]|uniref:metallophosphoesterase family protein n=1 Tax=Paenibacillus sp. FSL R7-0302 TaxID=2921681 RepID=UPI0030F61BB6
MKKSKAGRERLKVVTIAEEPLEWIPYVTAARGSQDIVYERLPIYQGEILGLPKEVEALIIASDLQGMALHDNGEYGGSLVGEKLPETLEHLLQLHLPDVNQDKVLVCLCGDLYGDTSVRGSSGDPLPVWRAFRSRFQAVLGVNGNHDDLSPEGEAELASTGGIHLFSKPSVLLHKGLMVAGLGGVTGRGDRPNRTPEPEYLETLGHLLQRGPHILLLHQGPEVPAAELHGHSATLAQLEAGPELLVCCGHIHWHQPLAELGNGTQVLNTDGRVLIFTAASPD